jgi:hypothetical protein
VRTVPLDKSDNCFTFRLAPSFKHFMAYCAEHNLDISSNNENSILAHSTIIMDEEEEVAKTRAPIPWIPIVEKTNEPFSIYSPTQGDDSNKQCHVIPHEDDEKDGDQQADRLLLLRYHQQFGHISFQ